jgi:thioredoxin-disulfide reductase
MLEKKQYDLLIIGGGPAGLTAAIYATRRKLKTMIVSMTIGGQMALTNEIENYPGFDFSEGMDLSMKMKDQAQKWGTEFDSNEVLSVVKGDNETFTVKTNKTEYEVKSVILAFGLTPRKLGVPGEEEFKGKGVTYCATCDGPLFKGKTIAIVGGGNSAIEAAEYMSKLAKKVYLVNRSELFRAIPHLLDKVSKLDNVEFYCNTKISEIKGSALVESATFVSTADESKQEEKKLDGVFIEIGYQSKTQWLKDTVDLNDRGEIIADRHTNTSVEGIFAAGDCTDIQYKQIIISAGEGSKAALEAYKYIVGREGKISAPDWGTCELVGTDKTVPVGLEK